VSQLFATFRFGDLPGFKDLSTDVATYVKSWLKFIWYVVIAAEALCFGDCIFLYSYTFTGL